MSYITSNLIKLQRGCCRFSSVRFNQSKTASGIIVNDSPFKNHDNWFKKLKFHMGIGDADKFTLRRASIFHYESCTDKLKPDLYFQNFQLPDTLYSFFLVIQLHVWMCQARSMKEGPEGRLLRNEITERMWQDMDNRLSKIDVFSSSLRKSTLMDLLYHHQSAIFSYDEGLLTDDRTLASALWRVFFSKADVDPRTLELAVKYVRTQMNHLKAISPRDWCLDGRFDWAAFPPLTTKA